MATLLISSFSRLTVIGRRCASEVLFKNGLFNKKACTSPMASKIQTSSTSYGLMEFFDKKDNWGEQSIKVGRPWKKDELRLKSNQDLHKLWYVFLKERNMLMTMAEEYKRQNELFPNPERLEKVEESMENLLDVVAERDVAFSELETGVSCEPGRRWAHNELGRGYWRKCTEHFVPIHMNARLRRSTALSGPWQQKWLRLYREKRLQERRRKLLHIVRKQRAYADVFPNVELPVDVSEFTETIAKTMKGPERSEANN